MNVNYHCDELISEIVMKFEETREQFIFQTISDFTSNVYQIEIDKQELIDAITLIRKSRGVDIIFKDPKIRLGYVAGYDDGKIDAEREKMRRRDVIEISDGLICPVLIIGKYGSWNRLAGLRPDFWIAGDDDCRAMLTMSAAKVGGVELNRIEDVLKIVEILRVEDVCK